MKIKFGLAIEGCDSNFEVFLVNIYKVATNKTTSLH